MAYSHSLSPPLSFPICQSKGKFFYISRNNWKKKTYHDESNVIVGFHTWIQSWIGNWRKHDSHRSAGLLRLVGFPSLHTHTRSAGVFWSNRFHFFILKISPTTTWVWLQRFAHWTHSRQEWTNILSWLFVVFDLPRKKGGGAQAEKQARGLFPLPSLPSFRNSETQSQRKKKDAVCPRKKKTHLNFSKFTIRILFRHVSLTCLRH